MAWGTTLEIFNSVGSLFCMFYYIGFLLYMVYVVIENSIYNNSEYFEKLAIIIIPFKNKNISQRLMPSLYLIRKVAGSIILVFFYEYPEIQAFLLALNYFSFWVYIFLRNPIKNTVFKVFFTITESMSCMSTMLYFFIVAASADNDRKSEVALTIYFSYLVLAQMILFAVFSIGMLIKLVVDKIKDMK